MLNPKIHTPNFVLLKQDTNSGSIQQITLCQKTFKILSTETLSSIPNEWSVQDFYDLLEEGKRFFKKQNLL